MFNTRKKIFVFYVITFLAVYFVGIIWTICIAKIDPDVTVSYLFHKNIVLNILVCPFYYFYIEFGIKVLIILFVVFLLGTLFPIIYSVKKRRISPYNVVYITVLIVYFFISFEFFTFGGDIVERLNKDYSKIESFEFYWHEGSAKDYSFVNSNPNTIHVVSDWNHYLNNEDKIALINGKKIIDAIDEFYNETQLYPDALEQLVPKYLEEVPETEYLGIWTSNSFHYAKDAENRWYNLKFYGFFENWYWNNEKKLWKFEED